MISALGLKISFLAIISILSCVYSEQQYGSPGGTLYVAEPSVSQKITVINRFTDENDGYLERTKRDATVPPPPLEKTVDRNISTWTTHLNDSHQQLMVHWVGEGSNVIICLARDSSTRNKGTISPSALYISYDYGKNFTNKTESFRLGDDANSGYAQLDKFFNHPKYPEFCVFVDSTNKKLYYTQDNGVTIHRTDLSFHPSELAFDEEVPNRYVILDKIDSMRSLYMTLDGGKTFKLIQSYVKTFLWSSAPGYSKVFYVERWKPGGNSTVLSVNDPANIMVNADELFADARDFQIKGDFMFATKQSKEKNSLDLYISHQRGPFFKAEFQTELDLNKFHIADVTDKRIFVSVMHTENLANLYVSEISRNFTQYNFVLSLEQVLCYFPDGNWKDSWLEDVTEDPFTDLYRVEGLKGIYIASKVNHKSQVSNIEPEHLVSLITFDHGVTWSPINPPAEDENGKPLNCHIENSCSLHLCQKFSQLYPVTRSASIMSSKSAPGIIMATGVLGKSLKGIPGVYISRDAGLTWRRILKDYYFFNYGDHGGVLVAVKYFKSRGETRRILYSTNEGIEWKSYEFNADDLRIYGLMTEPGENTTTFTMFGSANEQHQWIIITIDLLNTFPRNCTEEDYKFWSPTPPNSSVSCVLGVRDTFQRRLAHTNCHNGIGYERPVKKELCECSRRDYECDFGFVLSHKVCVRNQSYDPYVTPSDCQPGHFYHRTKGYRKIDGDVCTTSYYMPYEPDLVPCPLGEPTEFILVALRDRIARIDLSDNTTLIPVRGQQNIVAIEFDMKNNCIYWADIEVDKIIRQCFNNGNAQETVVDTELASIEGMALDWISNVLFFVDGLRKKIEAVRTDLSSRGRMRATILDSKVLSKPRGIAVHPRAGYLFWTDWDRNSPSVSRSNLDGKEVKKLFTNPIVKWPNGITIDQMADRIYWVDAMEDYIASADLNGQYFRRILWNDEKVTHPFAVAVLKNKMYWDDWKAKSIFTADKDTGANIVTINDSLSGLMDLKVFAYFMQHGSNACSYKNTSCDTLCFGGPGNTFSCLCPDGFKSVNGKCMCPSGMEPAPNMTCAKHDGSCSADEFTCKNGVCITNTWRCDGNDDCGDNSDEASCSCEPHMMACDDSRCYLPHWRCDGDMDCLDMSDEKDCGKQNCTENQFTCANGNCIEKRWVCDGDNDCKDGSDERNCTQSLPKRPDTLSCVAGHVFLCGNDSNGLCIPNSWVCDGERDCPGAEDEREERCKNSTCAPYMHRCPSGKCIYMSWVCDGENDCSDAEASDEKDCAPRQHTKLLPRPEKPDFPNNGTCNDWMYKCDNGNCLPYWWRCDGIDDCGDNSDEVACGLIYRDKTPANPDHDATRQRCGKNMFTCSPGVCIPLSWVCDGTSDCADGADELRCARTSPRTPRCDADSTPCADGRACVRDHQLCDGVPDCADRSDEQHCANVSMSWVCDGTSDCADGADELRCARTSPRTPRCDADSTPCADGRACVRDHQLCDGVPDCADRSDEQHCANVSMSWVCDGTSDCADGADELRCARTSPRTPRCDADSTPCADGRACVRDHQLCDGVPDCADRSDEQHCANKHKTTVECSEHHFSCDDGTRCLMQVMVCNGYQDCYDSTDEANCSSDASEDHLYQFLSIGVDQSSINSTSFLISCWMAQQKTVLYSFLPSIAKVGDGVWKNMTWTTDSVFRFTDLEPFTNYNVTVYIQDSKSNKTYASMKYVNTTTGEGKPSPPRGLTVRQMVGNRVNLLWDPPSEPRGVIRHYTVHYVPPLPPMERILPAPDNNASVSFVIHGYFKPNKNYSFWVTATNNVFTSDSSAIMNLTFDEGGDVDDIVNASMSRLSPTSVSLKWNKLRGVEGYLVETRLPMRYPQPPVINTTDNTAIVENLPKNVNVYIEIKAYKSGVIGQPFTIPFFSEGTSDELVGLNAEPVRRNQSAMKLSWTAPPVSDKVPEYQVHYLPLKDLRQQSGRLGNETRVATNSTSIVVEGLQPCETYVFAVNMVGGPLSFLKEFVTPEDPKAPVRNLRFNFDPKKSELQLMWNANCNKITEPISYRLDITELTHNTISRYLLKPTTDQHIEHVIENVPLGGRYNVCIHTSVKDSQETCALTRSGEIESPHAVVAWLSPNGHLMVSWQHPEDNHTDPKHKYQIIVSDKEIPEDLLHPSDDMKTVEADFSPLLMTAKSVPRGPLFVSVRAVTEDGYYSDLSEVRTLTMEGAEPLESDSTASAMGAVWWGAGAACVAAVALGAALLHMALRHRRLARSLLRLAATPRYDSRRGQATIDHDDDDVPPITGFSDDEPLVIA